MLPIHRCRKRLVAARPQGSRAARIARVPRLQHVCAL